MVLQPFRNRWVAAMIETHIEYGRVIFYLSDSSPTIHQIHLAMKVNQLARHHYKMTTKRIESPLLLHENAHA